MILVNNYKHKYSYYINMLYFLYNFIIDTFYYIKYFIYFVIFLFILTNNLLFYKITGNFNKNLIKLLYKTINLNGCLLIKLVQWLLTNFKFIQNDKYKYKYIIDLFESFYENCDVHSIEYTKKLFHKEFSQNFDDIIQLDPQFNIKSGSIAQVYKVKFKNNINTNTNTNTNTDTNLFNQFYTNINFRHESFDSSQLLSDTICTDNYFAIKVVHPQIQYQMIYPIYFVKLYRFFVTYIPFFKKYNIIFSFDNFFDNLKKQVDMNNEYKNISYFYNTYISNPYIVIPKPLFSTKNFLIMEYCDGYYLQDFDITDINKQKIIALLVLFLKDNYLNIDYFHGDLHDSNWKIRKYKDFYQIIVYDFGLIVENKLQNVYKSIIYNIDNNNFNNIALILYHNAINVNIEQDIFVNNFVNYITTYILKNSYDIYSNKCIKAMYSFCIQNNYILKNNLFELFISVILFKNYIDKYILVYDSQNETNFAIKLNFYYYNLCKSLSIFDDVKKYIEEYYINNPEIIKNYSYKNLYFEQINDNHNDNNISNNIENIDI